VKSLWASFRYAFRGMFLVFTTERNMKLHLGAAILALCLSWYLKLSWGEFLYIALSIALVFTAEAFNTALEALVDLVSPDYHPLAGKAKDIAAGAVLITAIHSIVVGIVVFGRHIFAYAK
jgi:diacylglycerol kinase